MFYFQIQSNTAHDEERDETIAEQAAYNAEFRTFQLEISSYDGCLARIESREILQSALLALNEADRLQNETLRDILRQTREVSERSVDYYTPLFDRINAQDKVITGLRVTIINDYKPPPLETCGVRPEPPVVLDGVEPIQETLD